MIIHYTIVIFLKKTLNHIGDLFENNSKITSCENLRAKLGLNDNKKIYRRQLSTQSLVLGKKSF